MIENKYFVIKKEWMSVLNPYERREFMALIDKIATLNGKQNNCYIVCNQDESYALEVLELILNGERIKNVNKSK